MQALYFGDGADQCGKTAFPIKIHSVIGGILRDQNQLPASACHQLLRLLKHRFHPAAFIRAPDRGNTAIGAAVAAPIRNFEIRGIDRRSQYPVALQLQFGLRTEPFDPLTG